MIGTHCPPKVTASTDNWLFSAMNRRAHRIKFTFSEKSTARTITSFQSSKCERKRVYSVVHDSAGILGKTLGFYQEQCNECAFE